MVLACLALALLGCSRDPAPRSLDFGAASGSGGTVTPGGDGVVTEWLAVFRTATDVRELDADTAAVKAIVGGAIVVSPVNCFDGPDGRRPRDDVRPGGRRPVEGSSWTRSSTQVDRPTVFVGRVRTMCLD